MNFEEMSKCLDSISREVWIQCDQKRRENDQLTKLDKFIAQHNIEVEGNSTVGFSKSDQKWYGWSKNAILGFGIGDKLFEEKRLSNKKISNMDEAKKSAIYFSKYAS